MEKFDKSVDNSDCIFPDDEILAKTGYRSCRSTTDARTQDLRSAQFNEVDREWLTAGERPAPRRPASRASPSGSATSSAVDDLTLTVPQGSFFALLGPSGCGKTTTLRMVAGLEDPTAGRVLHRRRRHHRPAALQAAGQHGLPVLRAVPAPDDLRERRLRAPAPRRQGRQAEDRGHARAGRSSRTTRSRKPAQLSGGQQQRVALGPGADQRAAACSCSTSRSARSTSSCAAQMQIELKRIQTEVGITFVHVTHDQEEAMTMADTIAVMNHGVIEQMGAPGELYENPATTFVANFLGQSNLIRPTCVEHRRRRRGHRRATARRSPCAAPRQLASTRGRRLAGRPAREDLRCSGRPRATATAPTGSPAAGHRRQLRRRQHPVPRRDAVGPGAHGLRAEHRRARSRSRPATRST